MGKKHEDVDKGTNRKTPGNNEGARPPKEEEFEEIQEKKVEREDQKPKEGRESKKHEEERQWQRDISKGD